MQQQQYILVILQVLVIVAKISSFLVLCKCIWITTPFISPALFIVFCINLGVLLIYIYNLIQQPNNWYLLLFLGYLDIYNASWNLIIILSSSYRQ